MDRKNKKILYERARSIYINSPITLEELARGLNLSFQSMMKKSASQEWGRMREMNLAKIELMEQLEWELVRDSIKRKLRH